MPIQNVLKVVEEELKLDLEPKEWLKCMEGSVLACQLKQKHATLKNVLVCYITVSARIERRRSIKI